MKGYTIYLIRHGITDANLEGKYIGLTDSYLSPVGIEEIFDKKEKFYYPPVQKIYCSPLKRCIQTAALFYPDSYTRLVPEMREMNFGDFENKKAVDLMEREDYKEFIKGGLDNPPPGGESIRDMIQRSYEGIDFIISDMMKEGFTTAAVFTHGGIIMNLLSCFGLPKGRPMDFPCDFAEGYEIHVTAQMWQRDNAFEIKGLFPFLKDEDTEETDD